MNKTIKKFLFSFLLLTSLFFSYELLNSNAFLPHYLPTNLSYERLPIAVLFWIVLTLLIPSKIEKPSDFYIVLHSIFPFYPLIIIFLYESYSVFNLLSVFLASFCIIYSLLFLIKVKLPVYSGPKLHIKWAWFFVLGLELIVYLYFDYSSISFSFEDIYVNRDLISSGQNSFFEYIHPLVSKVFFPLIIINAMLRRQLFIFIAGVLLAVSFFFLTQHRASLLFPFFAIFIYYAFTRAVKAGSWFFIACIFYSNLFFLFVSLLFSNLLMLDFGVRRFFFTPAWLVMYYKEFSNSNPFNYFSDSKISFGLVDNIYNDSVPVLIADLIGDPGFANSNYIGSGFVQLGFVAVLIYALIVVLTLVFVDSLGRKTGQNGLIVSVLAAPFLWLFNSSDLPVVYFTHGLLLSLVMICLFNNSPAISMKIPKKGGY